MDGNSHESPQKAARLSVRLVVGLLGAFFGFPALWIAISSLTEPDGRDRVFPILLLPSMIAVGLAAGWAALSVITPVRVAGWGAAGFGAGFLLDGMLGCLDAGEVLGPSALVLSLIFMVIGYRENPCDKGRPTPPAR